VAYAPCFRPLATRASGIIHKYSIMSRANLSHLEKNYECGRMNDEWGTSGNTEEERGSGVRRPEGRWPQMDADEHGWD
jgi:hypothetical protein